MSDTATRHDSNLCEHGLSQMLCYRCAIIAESKRVAAMVARITELESDIDRWEIARTVWMATDVAKDTKIAELEFQRDDARSHVQSLNRQIEHIKANLNRQIGHMKAIYKGRDEAKQLVIEQLERQLKERNEELTNSQQLLSELRTRCQEWAYNLSQDDDISDVPVWVKTTILEMRKEFTSDNTEPPQPAGDQTHCAGHGEFVPTVNNECIRCGLRVLSGSSTA